MPDLAEELQAIHALHAQVAQGNVHGTYFIQDRQRLLAITGLEYRLAAQLREHLDRYSEDKGVILKYQNPDRQYHLGGPLRKKDT
ncbi:hypothetical protein EMIT0P176_50192 [Pseudomonas sp. IT-P176]